MHTFSILYIGQWSTLYIMPISCLTIYFGSGRSLLDVILSLTGYLVGVLANHLCSIPLSLLGIPLAQVQAKFHAPFLLAAILLSLLLLMAVRRFFILPKLPLLQDCPPGILRAFLLELVIGVGLLAINFIYGESVQYPTEVLAWNGIVITALTLSAVILFYSTYSLLQRDHELSLQQQELAVMKDYTRRMESFYEEMRTFRHDYRHILSTLQHYIDSDDREALRQYFHDKILPSGSLLESDGFLLGKLHLVADPALKGLLYTKLLAMQNLRLQVTLELAEPVAGINMNSLELCRILGILLDNAMEGSAESPEKKAALAVVCMEASVIFVVSNSTLPIKVPVSRLFERDYTTKEHHEGLGLATVLKVTNALPQASLSTEYQDGMFVQRLEIQGTDSCG